MEEMSRRLVVGPERAVAASNAGLFVSRGMGRHPDRVIDTWELIFVRCGVLGLAEAGRAFEVSAGETLLLWPGRRHYGTLDYGEDLAFYWVHFGLGPPARGRAEEAVTVAQWSKPPRPDRLTELLHWHLDERVAGRRRGQAASARVRLMLCEVAADPGEPAGAASTLAGRAQRWIDAHAHQPVTASDVARALHCSTDHLNRSVRAAHGHTLTEAIHRRRLRDAAVLLRTSDLNVDEVARRCGFSQAGYFRRIFRRHHGMSPSRFRRLHPRQPINWR